MNVRVTKLSNVVRVSGFGIQGDGVTEDEALTWWAYSGAYAITSATRDDDGLITTAIVVWPDGATGTFTTVTKNETFTVIDAYTVTHSVFEKTATQPAVTRDEDGNVIAQPAITIS